MAIHLRLVATHSAAQLVVAVEERLPHTEDVAVMHQHKLLTTTKTTFLQVTDTMKSLYRSQQRRASSKISPNTSPDNHSILVAKKKNPQRQYKVRTLSLFTLSKGATLN
jgi:hypothetical protein